MAHKEDVEIGLMDAFLKARPDFFKRGDDAPYETCSDGIVRHKTGCVHGCGNRYSVKEHPYAHPCTLFKGHSKPCVFTCEKRRKKPNAK